MAPAAVPSAEKQGTLHDSQGRVSEARKSENSRREGHREAWTPPPPPALEDVGRETPSLLEDRTRDAPPSEKAEGAPIPSEPEPEPELESESEPEPEPEPGPEP